MSWFVVAADADGAGAGAGAGAADATDDDWGKNNLDCFVDAVPQPRILWHLIRIWVTALGDRPRTGKAISILCVRSSTNQSSDTRVECVLLEEATNCLLSVSAYQ